MRLYIKNMVCNRCKLVVKNELEKLELSPVAVNLGEVDIAEEQLTTAQTEAVNSVLVPMGFELIDSKKSRIIEKIKSMVINLIRDPETNTRLKHSEYISQSLNYDYTYLSRLFSEVEGITIEQYSIGQKIELVKELLIYDELSLSEIAHRLEYSSVAHLSAQFKKVTGLTPSFYKNMANHPRTTLDEVGKKPL